MRVFSALMVNVLFVMSCGTPVGMPDSVGVKHVAIPKYKIAVAKASGVYPQFCELQFTFTNTYPYPDKLWMQFLVLDHGKNTLQESSVFFDTTLPNRHNTQKSPVTAPCDRIYQVLFTTKADVVEPNRFTWPSPSSNELTGCADPKIRQEFPVRCRYYLGQ